jgi:hypothetical protein
MAKRIRISVDNNSDVHFDYGKGGETLCGLDVIGDSFLNMTEGKATNRRVSCKHCIQIVSFCKKIKSTEYLN